MIKVLGISCPGKQIHFYALICGCFDGSGFRGFLPCTPSSGCNSSGFHLHLFLLRFWLHIFHNSITRFYVKTLFRPPDLYQFSLYTTSSYSVSIFALCSSSSAASSSKRVLTSPLVTTFSILA